MNLLLLSSFLLLFLVATSVQVVVVFAQQTSSNTCTSSFHLTKITTTLSNPPPSQVADIATLPETAKHYQLDCLTLTQDFPVTSNRRCASPPSQRLQLCTAPVDSATSSSTSWTCQDISTYLTIPLTTTIVGSRNGPELRIKIRWSSTLSDIDCFPRTMTTTVVGLAVPEPGTELGVSIAFIVVVVVVAGGAVAYGFYALWRVSKKFEHRDYRQSPIRGTMSAERKRSSTVEQYRATLKALGAPENISSFYDEDNNNNNMNQPDFYGDGDQQQDEEEDVHTMSAEDIDHHCQEDADEDYDEEEFEDEEDRHQYHLQKQAWLASSNAVAAPQRLVLDNNQVLESVSKPVPWYQREQQQQIKNTTTSRREPHDYIDGNDVTAVNRTPGVPYPRRTHPASSPRPQQQQQQQNIVSASSPVVSRNLHANNNNTTTPSSSPFATVNASPHVLRQQQQQPQPKERSYFVGGRR